MFFFLLSPRYCTLYNEHVSSFFILIKDAFLYCYTTETISKIHSNCSVSGSFITLLIVRRECYFVTLFTTRSWVRDMLRPSERTSPCSVLIDPDRTFTLRLGVPFYFGIRGANLYHLWIAYPDCIWSDLRSKLDFCNTRIRMSLLVTGDNWRSLAQWPPVSTGLRFGHLRPRCVSK